MPLEVISLGAGVQSTAMALMAAHGEIEPMPDYANALIRDMPDYERAGLRKGGKLFLHRSLVPLAEAPIGGDSAQPDLWVGECEGMCGV